MMICYNEWYYKSLILFSLCVFIEDGYDKSRYDTWRPRESQYKIDVDIKAYRKTNELRLPASKHQRYSSLQTHFEYFKRDIPSNNGVLYSVFEMKTKFVEDAPYSVPAGPSSPVRYPRIRMAGQRTVRCGRKEIGVLLLH